MYNQGQRGEGGENPVESPTFVTFAPWPAGILATLRDTHVVGDVAVIVSVILLTVTVGDVRRY